MSDTRHVYDTTHGPCARFFYTRTAQKAYTVCAPAQYVGFKPCLSRSIEVEVEDRPIVFVIRLRDDDCRRRRLSTSMDAQLLALAKAQDDFRQQVAVGLTDLKSIADACAREHAGEVKHHASEQERARIAIEGANAERDRLEQKLMQCEHALSETKHALVEMKEKAKDVRVCDACVGRGGNFEHDVDYPARDAV